jgi:hypothetical protein
MNEFLAALKADLLDRRLRALMILVVAGLIAAVAYAVLGGSGSTPPATTPSLTGASGSGGSITPVAAGSNPNQALAETPGGASKQRDGSTRDPFNPLPGAASTSATAGKGGSATSGKSETKQSAGGTPPTRPAPVATKPKGPTYVVSALMGQVPPGTAVQSAQLTPYTELKFQQKLPSPELRLLAFDGVSSDGKQAKFKLIGEAIPRGGLAKCSPSPTQCQVIALEANQTEELEYLPPTGAGQVYDLQVTGISSH